MTTVPPTIFDYELVIIDLREMSVGWYAAHAQKKPEFEKFFKSGGMCYVIIDGYYKRDFASNFGWCPFADELEIENKSGETVTCESMDAKFIFDSIKFSWSCFFSKCPKNAIVLASNRAGDPISIMVPYESGNCIFLPLTDETDKLLDLLIKEGLNIIPKREEEKEEFVPTEIPSWVPAFLTETELKLLKTRNEIDEKLGKYNRFRPLFWETGDNLQKLVIDAFKELGIKVTKLPKESHGDFEFPINGDLIGACEVKGLSGNANRQDLRQLLDYFIEQRDIEKRKIQGIFIVNHFRKQNPTERGNPATEDALDLIQKYDFRLMTTIELYDCLMKFWENKLTTDVFLKRFQ